VSVCYGFGGDEVMARYIRKTFRDKDGIVVRLPKAIAPPPDTPVRIEWEGDVVTVHILRDDKDCSATP
jgi:hypothetical protein